MSISETLRSRGLRPKKALGQNFLVDPRAAALIAERATTPPGGAVLEIGAGLGALTRPLLARAGRVVAIERDRDLVPILREELAGAIAEGQLELIEADALDIDWGEALRAGPAPRVVAGNLPYLLTGRLLERSVGLSKEIELAIFMVQLEVAARLCARPGTHEYGALTVFTQAAFKVERLLVARAGAFYPRPDVDSAVITLTPLRPARAEETPAFREAVKAAFGTRRKTLRNAWKGLYGLSREELEQRALDRGISLDARGETLAVEDFERMARASDSAEG